MVGMGDDAVVRLKPADTVGARFEIDDLPGRADHEIRRARASGIGHWSQRLLESLRVQHFPAAHMERFLIWVAAVVGRGETVFDEADPAFVDAHFPASDPGLGEADEARLRRSARAQDESAAM